MSTAAPAAPALLPFDRTSKAFHQRWWTLGVLCLALLIIIVDNSILNVAIPTLVRDLDASNSQLQWMVDSYTLVFAGLLLTAGSLGDRFGRRGALQLGLTIFGIGSLASALVNTPNQLIVTRAFMGIGGAFIMPATLSIITNTFPPEERGRAIGLWAAIAGVATALGPISGGFLIEHFYWGSIFLVNLPIVVVALERERVRHPDVEGPVEARARPDRCGAVDRRPDGARLRLHPGARQRLDVAEHPARVRVLDHRAGRVRDLGVVLQEPDARHVVLQEPAVHRREPRHHAAVLRDVRLDLPAHAVPAVRHGLLRAQGRRGVAPDGAHDAHRGAEQRAHRRAVRYEARRRQRARRSPASGSRCSPPCRPRTSRTGATSRGAWSSWRPAWV